MFVDHLFFRIALNKDGYLIEVDDCTSDLETIGDVEN